MLKWDIPGFGPIAIEYLVTDFTGTLSVDGKLLPEVRELLQELASILTVHVVTADTFGKARAELEGINCTLQVILGKDLDVQKEKYVQGLEADKVVAIGNGCNDCLMLKTARLGIAVIEEEGCAVSAVLNADILVRSIHDGLNLLLHPKRLKATLRF